MGYTLYMRKLAIVFCLTMGAFWAGKTITQPKTCGAACAPALITVTAPEFNQKTQDAAATILDIRTAEEFSQGHVYGAVNVDFYQTAQFEAYLDQLDKAKPYLIYCRSGNRSGQALKIMETKGFTKVTNLKGGIAAWQAAGLELEK